MVPQLRVFLLCALLLRAAGTLADPDPVEQAAHEPTAAQGREVRDVLLTRPGEDKAGPDGLGRFGTRVRSSRSSWRSESSPSFFPLSDSSSWVASGSAVFLASAFPGGLYPAAGRKRTGDSRPEPGERHQDGQLR
uniref:Putative secreted protein n=1 Tax=Ixodes ricinus TaxID=34613 RepID=A0A090XEQ3_IXORI